MTVQLNTEVFSPLDGFYLCAIYEERRLLTDFIGNPLELWTGSNYQCVPLKGA